MHRSCTVQSLFFHCPLTVLSIPSHCPLTTRLLSDMRERESRGSAKTFLSLTSQVDHGEQLHVGGCHTRRVCEGAPAFLSLCLSLRFCDVRLSFPPANAAFRIICLLFADGRRCAAGRSHTVRNRLQLRRTCVPTPTPPLMLSAADLFVLQFCFALADLLDVVRTQI